MNNVKQYRIIRVIAKDRTHIPIAEIESFSVTGRLLYNSKKRFSNTYTEFEVAMMINLWNGSVWANLKNGKRKLIKRVHD